MIENKTKGWHGCFSLAGRNSAEKYHIILHQDEILSNEHKKIKIKDIFTPDDEKEESFEEINNINVFKAYNSNKRERLTIEKNNEIDKNEEREQKFRYHLTHMRQVDKEKQEDEIEFLNTSSIAPSVMSPPEI